MDFDDSLMPPDPFADDPEDPAALFDDDVDEPLSDDERHALREDLANVRRFRELLEPPRGSGCGDDL